MSPSGQQRNYEGYLCAISRKLVGKHFKVQLALQQKKTLHSDTSPEYTAGLATGQAEADEVTDG